MSNDMVMLSQEEQDAMKNMLKDLLFGSSGFFKDAPEEGKAAALDIINNTEFGYLEGHEPR